MTQEERDQLDRIEKKLDRLLHILGDDTMDMRAEAKRVLAMIQERERRKQERKAKEGKKL